LKKSFFSLNAPLKTIKGMDALPVNEVPVPARLIVFMKQHYGKGCIPLVKKGDRVKQGQTIGSTENFAAVDIHAPASGEITDILQLPNPYGGNSTAVIIENDFRDERIERNTDPDYLEREPRELFYKLRRLGVTGINLEPIPLDTIAYPISTESDHKLALEELPPIDRLIITAVDEEPMMASCENSLSYYRDQVPDAVNLMKHLYEVNGTVTIAAPATKYDKATEAAKGTADVQIVSARYPNTLPELMAMKITGREIPASGSPRMAGVVVIPLRTAVHALRAVRDGDPVTKIIVTFAGDAVKPPRLLKATIGTPIREVLHFCDVKESSLARLVLGGPIRGKAQFSLDIPVVKGACAIQVMTHKTITPVAENNCINCGSCVEHCPVNLQPNILSRHMQFFNLDNKIRKQFTACIECGMCGYVCPARRPMLQYMQNAKVALNIPRRGIII